MPLVLALLLILMFGLVYLHYIWPLVLSGILAVVFQEYENDEDSDLGWISYLSKIIFSLYLVFLIVMANTVWD